MKEIEQIEAELERKEQYLNEYHSVYYLPPHARDSYSTPLSIPLNINLGNSDD